jgi:hypothetical protein
MKCPLNGECTGCPSCRPDYLAMLTETPAAAARRLTAQTEQMLRNNQLRVGVRNDDDDTTDDNGVPDGYAAPLAKLRAAARVRAPRQPVPTDDPAYQPKGTPPDGYALALRARQEAA